MGGSGVATGVTPGLRWSYGQNRHVREGAEIVVKSTSTVEAKGKLRYLQVKSANSTPTVQNRSEASMRTTE